MIREQHNPPVVPGQNQENSHKDWPNLHKSAEISSRHFLVSPVKNDLALGRGRENLAEEVGFEPTVPLGTTVFKTAAFNRSAIPPCAKLRTLG